MKRTILVLALTLLGSTAMADTKTKIMFGERFEGSECTLNYNGDEVFCPSNVVELAQDISCLGFIRISGKSRLVIFGQVYAGKHHSEFGEFELKAVVAEYNGHTAQVKNGACTSNTEELTCSLLVPSSFNLPSRLMLRMKIDNVKHTYYPKKFDKCEAKGRILNEYDAMQE